MNVEKKVFKRKIERMKEVHKKGQSKRKESDGQEGEQCVEDSADVEASTPTAASTIPSSILTDVDFESMRGEVSDKTLDAVADLGFTKMTEIQAKTIKPLLEV